MITNTSALPSINALWIGENLGPISRCCLTSFIMRGHQVNLFAYHDIQDIPNGVTVCDANSIIHHSKIFKHKKKQSYGPFSDIFSYELLNHIDNGIYVDCDIYCLKPMTIPDHGYLFGYENESLMNVAVLAMPNQSQLLNALTNIGVEPKFVPEWYSTTRKLRLLAKRFFGFANHISDMSWGVTGPSALTYYAKVNNVEKYAQPLDVLYPIQFDTVYRLLEPNGHIYQIATDQSVCVHLYNEVLKKIDLATINPTSILAQMLENKI